MVMLCLVPPPPLAIIISSQARTTNGKKDCEETIQVCTSYKTCIFSHISAPECPECRKQRGVKGGVHTYGITYLGFSHY
ncbi:hypothetical protein DFP73DRAFT_547124 [Morchella snyderi]|nr:hypothetical protein DFP73DRAFT_547124 [Morchella snyderi]